MLLAWIATKSATNVTELIGLAKWALGLHPKNKKHQVSAIQFVVFGKNTVPTQYPQLFLGVLLAWCNRVAVATWKNATKPSIKCKPTACQFCKQQEKMVSLLFLGRFEGCDVLWRKMGGRERAASHDSEQWRCRLRVFSLRAGRVPHGRHQQYGRAISRAVGDGGRTHCRWS